MVEIVLSKNGIPIRLTDERWAHITEEHCELAGMRLEVMDTIANPTKIIEGLNSALMAISEIEEGKCLIAVYRELDKDNDGFIITAFLTRKTKPLKRRKQIWPK